MSSQILLLSVLVLVGVSMASPVPRYLVIPLDNVEVTSALMDTVYRVRRSAQQEQAPAEVGRQADRRQSLEQRPINEGPVPAPFINAVRAAGIPNADDSLASGSNVYGHPPKGNDYVDYGAYTGKHGAFGMYADYPVALKGHH